MEALMRKTAQAAKEQNDRFNTNIKQMQELNERFCNHQLASRDMTIKLLEHNNKVLRAKLKAVEKANGQLG